MTILLNVRQRSVIPLSTKISTVRLGEKQLQTSEAHKTGYESES